MTVTYKGEKPGGREATNDAGSRSYTRVFELTTDSKADGAYAVGSHASLPSIADVHPDDSAAFCVSIQVKNTNPYKGWEVTCKYSDKRDLTSAGNDPTNDEVLVSWSSEAYEEVILWDVVADEPILNTAGDFFSEPPTREAAHLIASISLSVTSVPSWVLSYQNAVNSDAVTIGGLAVGIGKAKMQNLTIGQRQLRNGVTWYPLSYQIKIKEEGWKFKPISTGFRQRLDPALFGVGILVDCINSGDQKPVSEPALLDVDGYQIADPTPASAYEMTFDIYPELTFASLPGVS